MPADFSHIAYPASLLPQMTINISNTVLQKALTYSVSSSGFLNTQY